MDWLAAGVNMQAERCKLLGQLQPPLVWSSPPCMVLRGSCAILPLPAWPPCFCGQLIASCMSSHMVTQPDVP